MQVTLARFQKLNQYIDAMAASAPGMHEYATTYIKTMQRRYLAFIEQYQADLIQGMRDVAQDYAELHQEVVQDLGDITQG